MSYIPPLDENAHQLRLPRSLDSHEIRILGSLLEKQLVTPEYYPLTLNALVAATKQRSNREPVMDLTVAQVRSAAERLQEEKLVWKVLGGRAVHYDHNLDTRWHLERREKAVLALFFLRGAQTAGELRARCDRLHSFDSIAEIDETLRSMASHSEPLVRELPRQPGQKETRWTHTTGGAAIELGPSTQGEAGEPLALRVRRLEEQVATLLTELRDLAKKLGE